MCAKKMELLCAKKMSDVCVLAILVISLSGFSYASLHQNHHHRHGLTSSQEWERTEVMDANGLFVLEWSVEAAKDIVFRITANTRGFVGLGFSYKSGKMANADLILAWVDDRTGKPNVLVNLLIYCCLILQKFRKSLTK